MDSKPIKTTQEEGCSDGDEAAALTGKPICTNTQIIHTCNNDILKTSEEVSDGVSKWNCKILAIISIICVVVVIGIFALIIPQTTGKHRIIRVQ